ncbi:hypothetical protein BLNAU_10984 [Blattamonas nauphoetae]|uniref:Uncharacterized protein n=1 Tax=Blattamonas nauphoetae TaxID=2049346 RepID=A0ABQ9XNL7_9EUKA|nr:hypothetical protein BLNAU_10984 [Blattamonas nauphoetae]
MEWFVEAVIGTDLIRKGYSSPSPLTFENIKIDSSSTIIIDSHASRHQPSHEGTLSSDISTLCKFFLDIHLTLNHHHCLDLPLDPKQKDIVFSRIMVALVEHFVTSGDLILQNSSLPDYSRLTNIFADFVRHSNNHNSFLVADHSFLRGDDVESSEQLLDAVRRVMETRSLETVQNAFDDWKEWVRMLVRIQKDVTLGTDLSFLQSRCLRSAILSLQTKHQLIANPLQIVEIPNTHRPHIKPSLLNHLHPNITPQNVFLANSVAYQSRQSLLTIHYLLTRPHPPSFPWDTRPLFVSESFLDVFHQPTPPFVDQNQKFDISLFDEADDAKVVASLRRCRNLVKTTKSTNCIVDIHTFRPFLIFGLHSSNSVIQFECGGLFFEIRKYFQTVEDPWEGQFASLRMAFRDGRHWEKMALLGLWIQWLEGRSESVRPQIVNASDFDFHGFLTTEMSNVTLFYMACRFIGGLLCNDAISMSFQWQMDFLHQFEKTNRMLSRISTAPRLFSKNDKSGLYSVPLAIILGSFLSIFRGCDFPSTLTYHITTDQDSSQYFIRRNLNPAYFLNHTSIVPSHRHTFFPMDLMFERVLRYCPVAFLKRLPEVSECTSRKFLQTPYVGLHSLLLRRPALNFNEEELRNLVSILFVELFPQDTTSANIHNLFSHFPPPRLIEILLSSPHLVKTSNFICVGVFNFFNNFSESSAPFGACASLAKVFQMLAPLEWYDDHVDPKLLWMVGNKVVSLHWLSIPAHFDSPLLCHLPSLAGAQRGTLQTLSPRSGIPSLVTPNNLQPNWKSIRTRSSKDRSLSEGIRVLSQCVRDLSTSDFPSPTIPPFLQKFITKKLLSPIPALVSAALEFFHRFVSGASDAVRMDLVKQGLLDSIRRFSGWNRRRAIVADVVVDVDGSPDGFVESILTLLSSPHLSVVAPALSLLRILLSESPRVNLFYLLSSGLINKSFIIVRPHTLPISGNETIINDFIILLINTTHYASPYSIHSLDFAAEANIWYEREIIFQKVVLPSYQFVIFLISNRYILDGDLFSNFMDLLGRFKIICPFNRPTLEFLLASPIVIVLSSCHSFVEDKFVNGYILEAFQISLKIWNEHGRAVTQSGKRMIRSLIHEGFEDTFDQKLMNNPHDEDYYDIVEECVSILKLQGANVEYPENVAGGDNGDDAADENDDEQDFENNEEEEEDSENIDEETTGN